MTSLSRFSRDEHWAPISCSTFLLFHLKDKITIWGHYYYVFFTMKKTKAQERIGNLSLFRIIRNRARIQVKAVLTLFSFQNITVFPRKASHVALSDVWSPTITVFFLQLTSFPLWNVDVFAGTLFAISLLFGHRVKDVLIFVKITLSFYIIICVLWIILRINKTSFFFPKKVFELVIEFEQEKAFCNA